MASELIVQTIQGPSSGANANKVIIPSGHTLHAAGHVMQVVQTVHTNAIAKASSLFSATGISASITPSSSTSKILVMYDVQYHIDTSPSSGGIGLQIYRNGSFLIGDDTGYRTAYSQLSASGTRPRGRTSFSYLDSPSTTSPVTYELYWATWDVATSQLSEGNVPSTITLMEIAQ